MPQVSKIRLDKKTEEELIKKLEKELQEDKDNLVISLLFPKETIGFNDGWRRATQRIIALLKDVKE